jgi:putative oxidoreductase
VASTLISSVMITAIRKVHGPKGPWVSNGGWEYNALVIAVATAFAERGPGTPSVDAARFPRLKGTGVAALSLAAAAAGSYLATSARFNQAAAETEPADDATQAEDTSGDRAPAADDGDTADEPRRFTRETADATADRA